MRSGPHLALAASCLAVVSCTRASAVAVVEDPEPAELPASSTLQSEALVTSALSVRVRDLESALDVAARALGIWTASTEPYDVRRTLVQFLGAGVDTRTLDFVDLRGVASFELSAWDDQHLELRGFVPSQAPGDLVRSVEGPVQPQPLGESMWELRTDGPGVLLREEAGGLAIGSSLKDLDVARATLDPPPSANVEFRGRGLGIGADVAEVLHGVPFAGDLGDSTSTAIDVSLDATRGLDASARFSLARAGGDSDWGPTLGAEDLRHPALPPDPLLSFAWAAPALAGGLDRITGQIAAEAPSLGAALVRGLAAFTAGSKRGWVALYLGPDGTVALALASAGEFTDGEQRARAFAETLRSGYRDDQRVQVGPKRTRRLAGRAVEIQTLRWRGEAPEDQPVRWLAGDASDARVEILSFGASDHAVVIIGGDASRTLRRSPSGTRSPSAARVGPRACHVCVRVDADQLASLLGWIVENTDEDEPTLGAARRLRREVPGMGLDLEVFVGLRAGQDALTFEGFVPAATLLADGPAVARLLDLVEGIFEERQRATSEASP